MTANDSVGPGSNQSPDAAARKRFWRRRWVQIVGGLLVLLIVVVILAPTVASTGPVRAIVVDKINNQLNGKLSMDGWSLGWFGGVELDGVKVDDAQGRRVLEVARIKVPLGLLDAARGNYNFGDAVIDRPTLVQVEVDEQGH